MIHLMGATFCEEWTEKGTHLICYEFEGNTFYSLTFYKSVVYANTIVGLLLSVFNLPGPVYNLAKKCKANVVNDKWLEDWYEQLTSFSYKLIESCNNHFR
jgi:hypothetical protein